MKFQTRFRQISFFFTFAQIFKIYRNFEIGTQKNSHFEISFYLKFEIFRNLSKFPCNFLGQTCIDLKDMDAQKAVYRNQMEECVENDYVTLDKIDVELKHAWKEGA